MIFATFGNPPFHFVRLAEAIDRIAPLFEEEFLVQHGHTAYPFRNVRTVPFLGSEQMLAAVRSASVIVAQGGWGTISECLALGKRVVAVPRRLGSEHNHPQEELVRMLENQGHLLAVYDVARLEDTLRMAPAWTPRPLVLGRAADVINNALQEWFGGR